MRNKVLQIAVMVSCCIVMAGCYGYSDTPETLQKEMSNLKSEIASLEYQKAVLETDIRNLKVESGTAKYIVTFSITQKHMSLDMTEYLKDIMNELTIQIPVDKEYYDSLDIGDTIADDFRVGSLIMKGSFGNWDVRVENKEIQ